MKFVHDVELDKKLVDDILAIRFKVFKDNHVDIGLKVLLHNLKMVSLDFGVSICKLERDYLKQALAVEFIDRFFFRYMGKGEYNLCPKEEIFNFVGSEPKKILLPDFYISNENKDDLILEKALTIKNLENWVKSHSLLQDTYVYLDVVSQIMSLYIYDPKGNL